MPRRRKGAPYRRLVISFWNDPEVRGNRAEVDGLKLEEKAVLVYLITNEHSHPCGLYRLLPAYVKEELGINRRKMRALFSGPLAPFASYDWETLEVFVHNMAKHQFDGGLRGQDKRIPWVMNHLLVVQSEALKAAFRSRYPDWGFDYDTFPPEDPDLFSQAKREGASPSDSGEFEEDAAESPPSAPSKRRKTKHNNKREGAPPPYEDEPPPKEPQKGQKALRGAKREGASPRKRKGSAGNDPRKCQKPTEGAEREGASPPAADQAENDSNGPPNPEFSTKGQDAYSQNKREGASYASPSPSPSPSPRKAKTPVPSVRSGGKRNRQEGEFPTEKKQSDHPELAATWPAVRKALYAPWWHGGNGDVILPGGKAVAMGLEQMLANDLLWQTGDSRLIVWAVENAAAVFQWDGTERHTLYWLKEPENLAHIEGAFHKAEPVAGEVQRLVSGVHGPTAASEPDDPLATRGAP